MELAIAQANKEGTLKDKGIVREKSFTCTLVYTPTPVSSFPVSST